MSNYKGTKLDKYDGIADIITPQEFGNVDDIIKQMEVVSSCGCKIGTVDTVESDTIRLTQDGSGQQHSISTEWVAQVDQHVHLNRNVFEAKDGWELTWPMATPDPDPLKQRHLPAAGN